MRILIQLLDRVLFPRYYVCSQNGKLRIHKPMPYKEGDRNVITFYYSVGGWKANHRYLRYIEEPHGEAFPYWDSEATSFCGYDTPQEAYRVAMGWSMDEGIPLNIQNKKQLRSLQRTRDTLLETNDWRKTLKEVVQ